MAHGRWQFVPSSLNLTTLLKGPKLVKIDRPKEHQSDVRNNREHARKGSHGVDWDNTAILAEEKNVPFRRLLFLQSAAATMNRMDGALPAVHARSLRHVLAT